MGTSSAWTPERRAAQAERIRQTKPWAASTGPRTAEGKASSSRNAYKGATRPRMRAAARVGAFTLRVVEVLNELHGRPVLSAASATPASRAPKVSHQQCFDRLWELEVQREAAIAAYLNLSEMPWSDTQSLLHTSSERRAKWLKLRE